VRGAAHALFEEFFDQVVCKGLEGEVSASAKESLYMILIETLEREADHINAEYRRVQQLAYGPAR
jgi:hypothetical protein